MLLPATQVRKTSGIKTYTAQGVQRDPPLVLLNKEKQMKKGQKILIIGHDSLSGSLQQLVEKLEEQMIGYVSKMTENIEELLIREITPVPIHLLSEAIVTETLAPQIDASGKTINDSYRRFHAKMPRFKPGLCRAERSPRPSI